jgi:hypothetical protein
LAKHVRGNYVMERERTTWFKIKNRNYSQMAGREELFALTAQLERQARVVDLTNNAPVSAEWKILTSEAGGPVGRSPMPSSHVPVGIHLTSCALRNEESYFSVEIENNRKVEAQIPISMNSKLFDRKGTIRFRELLLLLGKAANTQDATTFKNDPERSRRERPSHIDEVSLLDWRGAPLDHQR